MLYRIPIIQLSPEDIILLQKTSKISFKAHIRRKCDTILLSSSRVWHNKGTYPHYPWLDEQLGSQRYRKFSVSIGRGRKAEIDSNNTDLVASLTKVIRLNPENVDTVYLELNNSNDLNLTKNKVIQFLKKVRILLSLFS